MCYLKVGSAPNYVSLTVIPRSFCNPQLQIKLGENFYCLKPCCGSGSGIRCFFGPEIRIMDPGWKKIQIRDPGWTFRILFLRTEYQFFGLKRITFWCGSGSWIFLDPGWKKVGSGIPDKYLGSALPVLSSYFFGFDSSPWNCMILIRLKIYSDPTLW